jgi:hypothetical protein
MVEEAKGKASEEGAKIVAAARAEAEQEATKAREQLREQVAVLAVKGAEPSCARGQRRRSRRAAGPPEDGALTMAELATIARPYAEALFKAVGNDDAAQLAQQVEPLAAVAGNEQLRSSPTTPRPAPPGV